MSIPLLVLLLLLEFKFIIKRPTVNSLFLVVVVVVIKIKKEKHNNQLKARLEQRKKAMVNQDRAKIQTKIQTSIKQEIPLKINETLSSLKAPRVVQKAKRRAHETAQMATQIATELFKSMAGVDVVGINYKGTGAAVTDFLAGRAILDVVAVGIGARI